MCKPLLSITSNWKGLCISRLNYIYFIHTLKIDFPKGLTKWPSCKYFNDFHKKWAKINCTFKTTLYLKPSVHNYYLWKCPDSTFAILLLRVFNCFVQLIIDV